MNQREKLKGIDGIRALACLWVVAHHVFMLLPRDVRDRSFFGWILMRGDRGVPIFFVLSGFLLSMPLLKGFSDGCRPRWDVYLIRRAGRIVPGYYACLLFCAAAQSRTKVLPDWTNVWLSLGFVNSFFPSSYYPISYNKPLWSIGVEVVFYVLLPLFMTAVFLCRSLLYVRALWLAVTLGLVLGNYFFVEQVQLWRGEALATPIDKDAGPWQAVVANPIALFAHFLVGLVVADVLLWVQRAGTNALGPAVERRGPNAFDVIALSCLSLIFMLDIERWVPGSAAAARRLHLSFDFPTFHLLVATLLVAAPLSELVGRALDIGFLRVTATLSFGIYLWHAFVIAALGRIDVTLLQPATVAAALVTYAIVLSISFAIAAASYIVLERPVMSLAQLYKPSREKCPSKVSSHLVYADRRA